MTTIRLRRSTAAEWVAANPVLALGEPGFERDTGKQKIGDGAAAWGALNYTGGGGGGSGLVYYNVRLYGALGDGVADDTAAFKAAIAAAFPTAGAVYVPPGYYKISSPLTIQPGNVGTNNIPAPVPSIVGHTGAGQIGDLPNDTSTVTLEATSTFPQGKYLIEYVAAGLQYGCTGAVVSGMTLRCNGRAAGFRAQGARMFDVSNLSIIQPAVPVTPGDGATGGFSITQTPGPGDGGAYCLFSNINVDRAMQDSFCEYGTRSGNNYMGCRSLTPVRNSFYARGSDAAYFGCTYEGGTTAVWLDASSTNKFFGMQSYAGAPAVNYPKGNAVYIFGGFGTTGVRYPGAKFYGCDFSNSPPAGSTEQAGSLVNIKANQPNLTLAAMFNGCLFTAGPNTTDWFYVEAAINGMVQVTDNEFKGAVTTNPWTDLSGLLRFTNCGGLTVPTSGEADATAALTLTTTSTDVPGCTATIFCPKGYLLVDGVFDFKFGANSELVAGSLVVDGTKQVRELYMQGNITRESGYQRWRIPVAAGSHTITLQARQLNGTGVHSTNPIHTSLFHQFVT